MYLTRSRWGARPSRGGPGALDRDRVVGIALHWPAMTRPLRGIDAVAAALRGWQDYHMDEHGWSDIAYQEAIDQDGNVYALRGLATQSGANGDQDVNARYGALLLVLAPGERPSRRMVQATRARIAAHRSLFPRSRAIVGHTDIRPEPTACPGPLTRAAIAAGTFNPRPTVATRVARARAALVAARAKAREATALLNEAQAGRPVVAKAAASAQAVVTSMNRLIRRTPRA